MPRHRQSTEDIMIMHVDFGKRRIEYDVRFDSKPYFRVSVDPEGKVHVVAPEGKTREAITERVHKKAPWILRQTSYFERLNPNPTPRSFIAGETHYYLGRQYRLKLIVSSEKPQVRLKGRFFHVSLPDPSNTKKIETLLHGWYREHAGNLFREYLNRGLLKMKRHGIGVPTLVVRTMKRRWGSCTKNGKILLNLELIKASADCVEYVVMHELCHMVEHNHTVRFYRLLSSLMPNWKKIKEKLEGIKLDFQLR